MAKMAKQVTRHATAADGVRVGLCGTIFRGSQCGTNPRESVNCPECRTALSYVRQVYPYHANYTDWRLTAKEERVGVERMIADMHGGTDD